MRFDTKKYISIASIFFDMNPIVNVRIPLELQKSVSKYSAQDGYANVQDLVRSLLREYALERKREELLRLWGSQKGTRKSKAELRSLVEKEFGIGL